MLRCDLCSRDFASEAGLKIHRGRAHPGMAFRDKPLADVAEFGREARRQEAEELAVVARAREIAKEEPPEREAPVLPKQEEIEAAAIEMAVGLGHRVKPWSHLGVGMATTRCVDCTAAAQIIGVTISGSAVEKLCRKNG